MNFYVTQALGFLIIIPAIAGWVRYKNINPAFYPFLIWIWVGLINESIGLIMMLRGYYNIMNFNIFLLIQSLLILNLFRRWRLFKPEKTYYLFFVIFIIAWLGETVFISKLTNAFNSYFLIFHSFVIVLMSISTINMLLMKERALLVKNSIFLNCGAFVIFFTLSVLTETFWAYGLKLSPSFTNGINHIIVIANTFCIFVYTLAIVWMPKKQPFTLQF